jgi:3-oxoadipate enol-lactonase
MPELAGDAAALVRALGVAPVHVVGLSLGGLIAFQLAVDHPTLVRSLSIVNSGPAVVPRTAGERFRLGLRVVLGPARLGRIIAKRLFPRPDQEPYRRELVASMASHDRRAYDLLMRAIVGWSVSDRLDAVRSPVLAVSGDRDYTPVARKEKYVRRLHDARLVVIPESGHATPLDQPAPFNASLLQFLESIP